jgi:glucokinase-like ROK family protein
LTKSRRGTYPYRTGDSALVRQINLSVVMHHLSEFAPISRAGLAERTGLNKTTVSSLVSELIKEGLVREIGYEADRTGRSSGRLAMMLTFNPQAGFIVSGEIGVDFITVICANFATEVIWRKSQQISPDLGQPVILDYALALLHEAVEHGRNTTGAFLGLTLGVPGLIDLDANKLLFAPNLKWKDVPLGEILQKTFNTRVMVDNEARMAALGEYYFGVARGVDEVLYISAGVGLGGGLLHGGRLYRGISGGANEIGHMTMDTDGELCACGNRGCWETQVSQKALFRLITRAAGQGEDTLLQDRLQGNFEKLSVPLVLEAAEAGDRVTLEALRIVGTHLGTGIASLINALNPELVIFGGSMSIVGNFLLPAMEEEINKRSLRWNREAARVVLAKYRSDASVMGGLALVYQSILAEPKNITSTGGNQSTTQELHPISDLLRKEASHSV